MKLVMIHGGFTAPVTYVQPEFEDLRRWFPSYERCTALEKGCREVAFEYVHMGDYAYTDEVLAEIDRHGLRPALYDELLGFAKKYPEEQLRYPIVALGFVVKYDGHRSAAVITRSGGCRDLCLRRSDISWNGGYRFLAVRE